MKVYTIEIADAIESEFSKFLKEWGGGYPMRFTRFIDLGGRQIDLYVYTAAKDVPPWLIMRIKSVFKNDQGECIQYHVELVGTDKNINEVMVSPEIWKLPALADKILTFCKNDMLVKIAESGDVLEAGTGGALESPQSSTGDTSDEEDYDDIDTAGILAGDGDAGGVDFNPEDVIAAANQDGEGDIDPSATTTEMNKESDEGDSGFNPEDVIKD